MADDEFYQEAIGQVLEMASKCDPLDILEISQPPKSLKIEMRTATKTPAEWLRLLCRDWANENEPIIAAMNERFIQYKSYLKGRLSSQLLCRLTLFGNEMKEIIGGADVTLTSNTKDLSFWKILGVEDSFDRAHIVTNIERFCSLYNICGDLSDGNLLNSEVANNGNNLFNVDPASAPASVDLSGNTLYPIDSCMAAHAIERIKSRIDAQHYVEEGETFSEVDEGEKAYHTVHYENRKARKLAMKKIRENLIQRQKDAALKRAENLVRSNHVPIEITQGPTMTKSTSDTVKKYAPLPANTMETTAESLEPPPKKLRSSIFVSTASDLDQIVTHSKNLWAKYSAVAKEHNQKMNWNLVAKELGIHVKVREKYARMHSRAKSRGFDFVNWGHYRIRDHPEYFLDPLRYDLDVNSIQSHGTLHCFEADDDSNPRHCSIMDINNQNVTSSAAISLAAEAAEVVTQDMGVDVITAVAEMKPVEVDDLEVAMDHIASEHQQEQFKNELRVDV